MPYSRFFIATVAAASLVVLVAGVAFASAPLPHTGKAYTTVSNKSGVGITLVTSASNPRVIQPGAAALGSQFALSGGSVLCHKAKKNPGFHGTPFALFGFPGAKLTLSHGKYGFSKSVTVRNTVPLGSSVKAFTLKLTIKGTVASANLITGAVKSTGGSCTSKKPLKYKAKLNDKIPVAPGQ